MTHKLVKDSQLPAPATRSSGRALTAAEFERLADVPAEEEWFANIDNPHTRRAYLNDIREFRKFAVIDTPTQMRAVTRAHVLAWRKDLERRELGSATVRRKLSALSSLFDYLCDENAVVTNPVDGVRRPKVESQEGKTPALGDAQARQLLKQPAGDDLKTLRDRAMLSILLYHGLRRDEVSKLKVHDIHQRRGVTHVRVHGKGSKIRHIPLHPDTQEAIMEYLEASGHAHDKGGALFRPTRNNRTGELERSLTGDAIYKLVRAYAQKLGLSIGAHALRATAATNALENEADIAQVQEWLGHANIATTRIYDKRRSRPQDSPTFKVSY